MGSEETGGGPLVPGMLLECTSESGVVLEVKPGDVIGREGDIDVSAVSDAGYMSRRHARFEYRRGRWSVENLSTKSFTYLNGRQLAAGESAELEPGDRLTFGTTRCTIRGS